MDHVVECLMLKRGQVQHALKRSDEALSTLDRAITIDGRNPLCKFHRATVLFATDRHQVSGHRSQGWVVGHRPGQVIRHPISRRSPGCVIGHQVTGTGHRSPMWVIGHRHGS